ncbi:MAG: NAD(P)H-hydrate dehydratase [Bacillota bacterium]
MLVATAAEMREIDKRAMDTGIPGLLLMENAGRAVAMEALGMEPQGPILVLAGKGNNGGDGFVAARHLHCQGVDVEICLVGRIDEVKGDARVNLEICRNMGLDVQEVPDPGEVLGLLPRAGLVVDALLGTGFSGVPRPPISSIISALNASGRPVLSVDIPSGVDADTGAADLAVRASLTVTFGLLKRGLLLYPGASCAGDVVVADISIPPSAVEAQGIKVRLVTEDLVKTLLPPRREDSHKGDFGHVLVLGGSLGFSGAAVLAAMGALRAGAGLVTVAVPSCIQHPVASSVKEAMTRGLPCGDDGRFRAEAAREVLEMAARAQVVAIGPGLGQGEGPRAVVREVLERCPVPVVLDADGLNNAVGLRPGGSRLVMTPHPGEMARLTRSTVQEVQRDRLFAATSLSEDTGSAVLLKGPPTVVAYGGLAYLNPTGNPGMASGGSGDVLTGIIAALMAQGLEPGEAAFLGAFLHGMAGDEALHEKGQRGMIAGDLLDHLPRVLGRLEGIL